MEREDIATIRRELERIRDSEDVIVFRKGARVIDKDRWVDLLAKHCGLIPDPRHFDPQWAAKDAKRNALLHGDARYSGDREAMNDKTAREDQIKPAEWWEISYQPDREVAYSFSKTAQPLHTDNAWFSDPGEINFFLMEKQAQSGGEQTIYPISRLIEDLGRKEPGLLQDLSSIQVVIKKGDNDMFNRTTIIRMEAKPKIFWNYYRTDKSRPEVAAMCEAFFKFLAAQTETKSVERIWCDTGDCLCFNDLHMLHGRTAFEASYPRERVLLHSVWKLPAAA